MRAQARREAPRREGFDAGEQLLRPLDLAERQRSLETLRKDDLHCRVCRARLERRRKHLLGRSERSGSVPLGPQHDRLRSPEALPPLEVGAVLVWGVEREVVTGVPEPSLRDERLRQRKQEGRKQLEDPLVRHLHAGREHLRPAAGERERPAELAEERIFVASVADAPSERDPGFEPCDRVFAAVDPVEIVTEVVIRTQRRRR